MISGTSRGHLGGISGASRGHLGGWQAWALHCETADRSYLPCDAAARGGARAVRPPRRRLSEPGRDPRCREIRRGLPPPWWRTCRAAHTDSSPPPPAGPSSSWRLAPLRRAGSCAEMLDTSPVSSDSALLRHGVHSTPLCPAASRCSRRSRSPAVSRGGGPCSQMPAYSRDCSQYTARARTSTPAPTPAGATQAQDLPRYRRGARVMHDAGGCAPRRPCRRWSTRQRGASSAPPGTAAFPFGRASGSARRQRDCSLSRASPASLAVGLRGWPLRSHRRGAHRLP